MRRLAPLSVAGMDRQDVGRILRVGQHADLDAPACQVDEGPHALRTRHEVGRDAVEAALDPTHGMGEPHSQKVGARRAALSLYRVVADERDVGPFEVELSGKEAAHGRRARQHRTVCVMLRIGRDPSERILERRRARIGLADDPSGRIDGRARPVAVEVRADLLDHPPRRQDVEVDVEGGRAGAEILIAHVAPADDRGQAVDGEGLVVHAPVEPEEVEGVGQHLRAAQIERVPQPHLDEGVRVELGQLGVEAGRAVVVEQQPDPHAAIGRALQCVEEEDAGEVAVPDVVLRVDRPDGHVG